MLPRTLCGAPLKNWGVICCGILLVLSPFISQPFGCSNFLLMFLRGENSLLGALSKAFCPFYLSFVAVRLNGKHALLVRGVQLAPRA
jgi:hypothetical protein